MKLQNSLGQQGKATVFGRAVETAGCTTEQMERMLELGDELDNLLGAGSAKKLLQGMFGCSSRKELDEERASRFLVALDRQIVASSTEPERPKDGIYRISRNDYRGGHRYDVHEGEKLLASRLPGITTPLNVLDKPALLPWMARLTGDAFKAEIRRVLIDEAMPDVAMVRKELIPLLDVDGYRLANATKQKAADRGTDTHTVAEQVAKLGVVSDADLIGLLRENEPLAANDVWLCCLALRDWFRRYQPRVLSAERMVACLHCRCAATLDLHVEIDDPMYGGEWILDIKTSGGIYESHALQTSFQGHALMQMKRGLHERHCSVYRRLRIGTLWVNANADGGCQIEEFDNSQKLLRAVQEVIDLYHWKRSNSWRKKPVSWPRNAKDLEEHKRLVKGKGAA